MGYTTLREGDKRQAEVGMLHRLDFVVRSIYLVVVRARHSGEGVRSDTGLYYWIVLRVLLRQNRGGMLANRTQLILLVSSRLPGLVLFHIYRKYLCTVEL